MSAMSPWRRLWLNVAAWAVTIIWVYVWIGSSVARSLFAGVEDVLAILAMAVLFVVWPTLIYWFCVPKAGNVKGWGVRLLLYLVAMTLIGIVAFVISVAASIHLFGLQWRF